VSEAVPVPKKRPKHGRSVQLNPAKVTEVMNGRGLSVEALANRSLKSVGTINNVLAGHAVYRTTALPIAEALGISLDVLLAGASSQNIVSTIHEYLVDEVLTDWQTASNGLRFQVCRLRHLELDRSARGKRFDLRDLATDEEQRCRTWIKRHPNVCETLNGHPNIIRNITAFHDPTENFYWVIDEWVDGELLMRKIGGQQFDQLLAKQLMLDLARGLQALNEQGIIRRELNPASVLIRHADGRAVLTEFELAKLIDRGPTVSTEECPVDPYRAGEANSDDVDRRADIFSWSRIAIHALLGKLPDSGEERELLDTVSIPPSIRDLLLRACAVLRSDRPDSMQDITSAIEKWEVQ